MLVHTFFSDTTGRSPDKAAVIVAGRTHTFHEVDQASDRLACEFQRLGVSRGDRIAVMLENSAEMVIAFWAVLKAGAVFVPISHTTKSEKLAFILSDSGACCFLAPAPLHHHAGPAATAAPSVRATIWVGDSPEVAGPRLDDILAQPHRRPDDPHLIDQDLCLIIYTSGSTGKPKGVMMTHRNIANNAWAISTYFANVPEDVILCVLPLAFNYGLSQILAGACVGYTVVLERSFAYPYEVLKRIGEHRVTGFPGVPTVFATLLQLAPFKGLDLSSLRYLSNAAAPLAPAHIRRLREVLPRVAIFSMYGLTECTRVCFLDPARIDAKVASVGRAIPNAETYIVDDQGRRSGPGGVGELVVRGAGVMRGYWRRPEDTAKALRDGDVAGEKVLYTGDLFRMDEDGDLYFVGRKDDVFKCRGEKISPREIENVLYELDAIVEAAVLGVADPLDGMAIKAFVVPGQGRVLTEQMVRKHCRGRLEPHMIPKFIELCPVLPKTDSGKITKAVLRAV